MRTFLIVALLVLFGCGSSPEQTQVSSTPPVSEPAPSPSPAPQPAPNPTPTPNPTPQPTPDPTPVPAPNPAPSPTPPPTPTIGSVTLNWEAPTENTDGTPLTDLAGYYVWYGTSSISMQSIQINNPGLLTYVVGNLVYGQQYQFFMTAYDSFGDISPDTDVVSSIAQ